MNIKLDKNDILFSKMIKLCDQKNYEKKKQQPNKKTSTETRKNMPRLYS